MDPKIRDFLSENGAKGGRANKGKESRRQIAKAAAQARWDKYRSERNTGKAV
jgi:hypothetical protein